MALYIFEIGTNFRRGDLLGAIDGGIMAEQPKLEEEAPAEAPQSTKWERISASFRRATGWIPIIGRLSECKWVNLKEAFYEVGCVILFSTLPLWFFPLISWVVFTVGFSVSETVQHGELLIYAATFSGTMVYFSSKRYGTFQSHSDAGEGPPLAISISFPYGGLFVILSAFICMFSAAGFFVLKTFERLPPQNVITLSASGASNLSWTLFIVSSVLFYCAVAYRNMLDESRGYRLQPERDIMEAWDQAK
jgi:hypothetical protein